MIHHATQRSGHTIHARHIESPTREFFVSWYSPAYLNVLLFDPGTRWARVLAQTTQGALRIAQYHHFSGRDFTILGARPT